MSNEFHKPAGSWVAIPTPMDEKSRIDYDVFAQLIDFQAKNGTSALLSLGSCGEVTLLSYEERHEVIKRVSALAKGKIPVYFGVTCPSTEETVKMAQYAEAQGADGLVFTVPPYITPPQEAVYEYYDTVMGAVSIPVAIYNNPTRVKVEVKPETIARLSEKHKHFVADKEALPKNSHFMEVMERTQGNLNILTCDSPGYATAFTTLAMGGHGLANIGGNVFPEEMAAISRPWTKWEDVVTTRELYFRYLPLLRKLYAITNPVYVKAGLRVLGFNVGKPRLPLPDVSPEAFADLEEHMRSLGLIDKYAVGSPIRS